MDILNIALTVLFMAGAVFMGKKVLDQRNQITIYCKYINGYRLFIMVCLVASVVLLFVGYSDILDLIRSLTISVMVGLFLCMREGVGDTGFVYNGLLYSFETVSHYDLKQTDKELIVYVVVRERQQESTFTLQFPKDQEQEVIDHLNDHLPKKQKRIKK